MAKLLILSIVACETSFEEIAELTKGCDIFKIGGTACTKHRDFTAEDILIDAYEAGWANVEKAEHLYDDGASMLYLDVLVPDEESSRVESWINENASAVSDDEWIEVGDEVDYNPPAGHIDNSFSGVVVGFKAPYIQIKDMNDDVFDSEVQYTAASVS
jgi:hypothetical protein